MTQLALSKLTKKEAITRFQNADTVTMKEYFSVNPQTREERAAVGGLIGKVRKVTAKQSSKVRLDDSWLTFDQYTHVYEDHRGFIVVYAHYENGDCYARMVYDVDPGE